MDVHIIWALLGELGIVTGLIGILLRRFEKRMEKRDKAKEQKEEARQKYEELNIKMSFASLSLAEATAEAVQRIPDAHCNGEMHDALKEANRIKKEYREFETKQTAKSLH